MLSKSLNQKKAQSFITYTMLIVIVVAALLAMRVYFLRAMQDKIRQTADVFGQGEQYEKGVTVETPTDAEGIEITLPSSEADECKKITGIVSALENQVSALREQANDFNKALLGLEEKNPRIKKAYDALIKRAEKKEKKEAKYRKKAAEYTSKAQDSTLTPEEKQSLLDTAQSYTSKADGLEEEANGLRKSAQDLKDLSSEDLEALQKYVNDLTEKADKIEMEIMKQKANYPDCF